MKKILSLDDALDLQSEHSNTLFKKHVNKYLMEIFEIIGTDKFHINKALGAEFFLDNGKKIIDFSGGIGVVGVGHNHPRIIAAEKKCHEKFVVDSMRMGPSKLQAALAYNISQLLPAPLEVCYFAVSGSESVESALKICERAQRNKGKDKLFQEK